MGVAGKRIVVGYDGSRASRRALFRAAELLGYGSRVTVVGLPPPETAGNGRPQTHRVLEDARAELARLQLRADVVEAAGAATAADALVHAALGVGADVLVLGEERDRNGIAPVSAQLLRDARCDVLVVR
jgi:nucleotide-binding universal stress UspA family protein